MRALLRVVPALACLGLALPVAAQILPADRLTTWSPGVVGGIPARTTICATVNASTYGNGASDASAGIQAAIDACPLGQVVQLSAGVFTLNASYVRIGKGITLRGAGAGLTTLQRTIGAVVGSDVPGPSPKPLVIIGPSRYPHPDESTARNLTADAVKGTTSVTVSSAAGYGAGQFVILDEDNYLTGSFIALPNRNGAPTSVTIWATDRVVWQKHNPTAPEDDPFPEALTWFSRSGRPVNEIKEIASVSGNTVTFTTPIHITYRVSHTAQLTRWTGVDNVHVKSAGLENLKVTGGDDGAIRFEAAAYSWVKNVEDTIWLGEGVAINQSFRCEVRDSYIHDAAKAVPGGGAYAISHADASAENLIENNVILKANKVMVARSAGAGSVVGYNYADDGFISYDLSWQEVGINGSHMVGPHHMLFEGNQSFNYDSDNTHGSALYHTVFRNHLMGFRRSFSGLSNGRASGLGYGSWWHSFVGNVQGISGQMAGWVYENTGNGSDPSDPWGGPDSIWKLGYDPIHWDQKADTKVQTTTIRDGNFDYVTNTIHWAASPQTLPNSLYRGSKPPFFAAYTWPWVDPVGGTKLFTLPARARYDAAAPNPFTLLVAKAGTGSGTVTSSPSGLSCGTECMVSYNSGTVINLTATATAGSTFTGWSGACTGTGACSVTMNAFKSVTATFVILQTTDLSITKTDGLATAIAGTPVTYTITAGNAGPTSVTGATVADTFPAILTGVTWTCTASAGSSCGAPSGSGNISQTVNLLVGGSATFVATGTLSPTASGTLANTASISAAGIFDPNGANNSATDTDTITQVSNLSITKTDGQATAGAGSPLTYTITAGNAGPSAVTGATVTDTFPAALTGVTWTCTASAGSSCGAASGSGNISTTVSLLVGGTATFMATGTLNVNATGTLVNTATVGVPGGVTDPVPGNNSATDTDTIIPAANLSITKTDGQATASPGQPITYTIVAGNAGPTAVIGAAVADTVPAALTGVTWTCSGSGGGTCLPTSGSGNIGNTVNLPVGATVTYTVMGTVVANPTALRNTATITAPAAVNDPNLANNTATDNDTLLCFSEIVLVPDGRLTQVDVASGATVWFASTVQIGSAYSVEFKNLTGIVAPGTLTLFSGDDACSFTTSVTVNDTVGVDPAGTGGLTRVSFSAAGAERFFRARLVNNTGGPETISVGWSDLTMFSPAWSTNGSFNTYYSFINTTGSTIAGTLTLRDLTGAPVATFPVSVPPRQTASTNTASLGVTRNRTGTATFVHNGPPGGVVPESAIANFSISPAYIQTVKFQAAREGR